jgi:hypothetical protein
MPIPTKLFDVQNGNGAVLDVTYPRATLIAFKDNASKDAVIDAFAAMGGYQDTVPDGNGSTIPNPQTKQQFYTKRITQFIRDTYKSYKISVAEKAAKATAETAAEAELPSA